MSGIPDGTSIIGKLDLELENKYKSFILHSSRIDVQYCLFISQIQQVSGINFQKATFFHSEHNYIFFGIPEIKQK